MVIILFFHYLTLDCPTECLDTLNDNTLNDTKSKTFISSKSQATELEKKFYSQKITIILARNWLFLVLAAKYYTPQDRKSLITQSK